MIASVNFALLLVLVASPADKSVVKSLMLAVSAGQEPAATHAISRLKALGPSAVRAIIDVGENLGGQERERVISLLSQFGGEAYEELRDAGADGSGWADGRWTLAIDAAAAMGEEIIPIALKELSKTRGSRGQGFAAKVLEAQGKLPVPSLMVMAEDPNPELRQSVVGLLGLARDRRTAELLVRIAAEPDGFIRTLAIEGLVRLRDDRVLPIARRTMHDGSSHMRGVSAVALGRLLPPARARSRLAFLARSDAEISVRGTAAELLRDAREPISVSLGERYDPVSLSPVAQPFWERRRALFVIVSGLAVLGVSFAGHALARRAPVLSVALARNLVPCILLLGVGWAWGRWVTAISWRTEYQFAAAACLGIFIPRARMGLVMQESPEWFSRIWLGHLAAVFSGYLLGWTQLWGWSLEWVDLFRLWRQGM